MFDLVPLAGSRREMADLKTQSQFVRKILEGHLPKAVAATVAPTSVGRDHQLGRFREPLRAHLPPPAQNAGGREPGRVMIDSDADPTLVARQVVDPIRNRLAES